MATPECQLEAARRLQSLRSRVEQACSRAGRSADSVRLIGVSKHFSAEVVAPFLELGLADLGENYVQEAAAKKPALGPCRWHLIGPLQRNKAGPAVELFDVIHTLAGEALVRRVDQRAALARRRVVGLLQIHQGGEETKHGMSPGELFALLEQLRREPPANIQLAGLMSIPPPVDEAEENRAHFRALRALLQEVQALQLPFWKGSELSMGMSDDFEVAIEEGATMIRVGRALFGERYH